MLQRNLKNDPNCEVGGWQNDNWQRTKVSHGTTVWDLYFRANQIWMFAVSHDFFRSSSDSNACYSDLEPIRSWLLCRGVRYVTGVLEYNWFLARFRDGWIITRRVGLSQRPRIRSSRLRLRWRLRSEEMEMFSEWLIPRHRLYTRLRYRIAWHVLIRLNGNQTS